MTRIYLSKYKPWGCKFVKHELLKQIYHENIYQVNFDSTKKDKEIVYRLAQYFRREFNYDFVQYSCNEDDLTHEAYIFKNYDDKAFGACCFRRREYTDTGKIWALQWIWLHPYFREKGELKKHWPFFKERYGDFHVEGPYSKAMRNALCKLDYKYKSDFKI